ncbi:regulatory protein RecX [Caproiciproducens sp. NJN-50]|uniref:regulatory protein RecX n=1 Tax=Acutalibacteraceae TaxID=3082771 RepID=UPI000FFDFA19|nr:MULTISPECIES: regulatory protein RecX [Acutalibacteraceae]QAT50878.1 regulatory protein RecX [Caproiciproducens sp. NJN-50]
MMLSAAEPRRKGLTALFIDGEFAVSVDTETFALSGLKPGAELTDERLHELIRKSDARRAQEKALYLLEHRAHSQKELADKVARTVPREAAERAARHLAELGMVNDGEYARNLAAELFERKGCSASRVRWELEKRGIGRDLAARIAEENAPDPVQAIRRLLEKKYARSLGDEKGRRRTVAALQRLGYRWDDIKSALREFEEDGNFAGCGEDDRQSD